MNAHSIPLAAALKRLHRGFPRAGPRPPRLARNTCRAHRAGAAVRNYRRTETRRHLQPGSGNNPAARHNPCQSTWICQAFFPPLPGSLAAPPKRQRQPKTIRAASERQSSSGERPFRLLCPDVRSGWAEPSTGSGQHPRLRGPEARSPEPRAQRRGGSAEGDGWPREQARRQTSLTKIELPAPGFRRPLLMIS